MQKQMLKKQQSGAIDLHIIILVIFVALAGALVGFRVVTSGDDEQGSATTENSENLTDQADSSLEESDEAEAVDENNSDPDEEASTETTETSTPTSTPGDSTTQALFTKGGVGGVEGTTINVSATMNGSYSGTCTFTFTFGNTTVSETSSISASNTCQREVSVFNFPKNGTYSLAIDFVSNDGSVTASIDGFEVLVSPTEFQFTKGGGDYDGSNVNVSQTSPTGHTGTCNYVFVNGNSRVEKSNSITNSRTCAISIPVSEFPKSGNWQFDLTFNGTTEFVVGTGGGFPITIN